MEKLNRLTSSIKLDCLEYLNYETVVHNWGEPMTKKEDPFWLEYGNEVAGKIKFFRNLSATNFDFSQVADIIKFVPFNPLRVSLITTTGNIRPHHDELGRLCCINFGIKNSSSATVYQSNTSLLSDYSITSADRLVINDGEAYLLDTSKIHEVHGDDSTRFLLSYSFGTRYEQILGAYNAFFNR